MGNISYVNSNGESVHSCCESNGIPLEGDKTTIDGIKYVVDSVEKIIQHGNASWKVTLR